MRKESVTIYLFCVFQHFDHEDKFLLWNCVWSLNFVVFIALEDNVLFIFFTKPKVLLFYLFFCFKAFQAYLCSYFIIFWTKYIFWKIINSLYDWCINYPHFVKLEENNWSKCNFSNVHKLAKNCLIFVNMS